MSKAAKVWLILAAVLVILGTVMFTVSMSAANWNFRDLGTQKFVTETYQITEEFGEFGKISIQAVTADITVKPSTDGKCSVATKLGKNVNLSIEVQNGVLTINATDTGKWYEHIGMGFGDSYITVYLPADSYETINIKSITGDTEISGGIGFKHIGIATETGEVSNYASATGSVILKATTGKIKAKNISSAVLDVSATTGNIEISGFSGGDIRADISTGKIELSDIRCKNLRSKGTTGKIELEDVIASGNINIERSTGDVELDDCDAGELYIKTGTGSISGSLLSDKIFVTKSSTGKVRVPGTTTGGKCELISNTGNIRIEIEGK